MSRENKNRKCSIGGRRPNFDDIFNDDMCSGYLSFDNQSNFNKNERDAIFPSTSSVFAFDGDEESHPSKLKKIDTLTLEYYEEFIENKFLNVKKMEFASKNFFENLSREIKTILGDVPNKRIAEILYGTSNGSEALSFATLRHYKNSNPYSLIDENLLDKWFLNLKSELRDHYLVFSNLINDYKLIYAEKRVFDLSKKWDSYNNKVISQGLNMETKKLDFIESALKGTPIENMSFELSCGVPSHGKIIRSYKYLYRVVCPLCSRIRKSYSYQDFVREAELRDARFKFTESEFNDRINEEFKKTRDRQKKVSEILFPFICNKHGEFNISMERIKEYNNWCEECYRDRSRLSIEQIIAKGDKYNFKLETPIKHIKEIKQPTRASLEWSCKYHPSYKFKDRPDDSALDLRPCTICSGGEITRERILRHLLSRLFHRNFGEKPTQIHEVLPYNKVVNLLPNNYKDLKIYKHMHFDAFSFIDITINNEDFTLRVVGEYMDREHASLEGYIERFKHRTPRRGSLKNDYLHLKSSDDFKQALNDNRLIDIYIIVDHTIRRDDFMEIIVLDFEKQIRDLFNIEDFRLKNFPRVNWRDLKQIDKLRQTFGDISRFK